MKNIWVQASKFSEVEENKFSLFKAPKFTYGVLILHPSSFPLTAVATYFEVFIPLAWSRGKIVPFAPSIRE